MIYISAAKTRLQFILLFYFVLLCSSVFNQQVTDKLIAVQYNGDAKVEVGSPFAGIEFHHSMPVPQRISFYYPVANSFDLSTDYWKRDTTFVASLSLKINNGVTSEIGKEPYQLELTPYYASFTKKYYDDYQIKITYNFSRNQSAAIVSYELTNTTGQTNTYEFATKYYLTLRSSHTYDFIDKIFPHFNNDKSAVFVDYDNKGAGGARIFFANAGDKPDGYDLSRESNTLNAGNRAVEKPYIKYSFKKKLLPHQKMVIVQIIGSVKQNEGQKISDYMIHNYKKEIRGYSNYILNECFNKGKIKLNDPVMDHSVYWAKAILAANSHYIDGSFVPMPCPAEYNFFFTHDVLLTDLAAVNFDLPRVRNDLNFIINHADKNKIIPHAYYWKDSTYKTEYADADNWNNYWFIILSAEYLLHSADTKFLNRLYPYLEKSLETGLRTKSDDGFIWSHRPDWWDIGKRNGPRAYMTILAVKALRSFNYISAALNHNLDRLKNYETLAEQMTESMNKKLWADDVNYLMNFYSDGKRDEHFYMGSLLAAHYGLLNPVRVEKLVGTVEEKLLDKNVGVFTVWPMDFNKLIDFWNFSGNEAGDPYYYINGGVWSHANAWYALALSSLNRKKEAADFVKKNMTVRGIMDGPNGQPAMYEVRNANLKDPKNYGTVDKPQFLWAAGWYLYSLYYLFVMNNNEWNIEFNPYLLKDQQNYSFDLSVNGKLVKVEIGKGKSQKIEIDGIGVNSFIIPNEINGAKSIQLAIGKIDDPFVKTTNSILKSCLFDKKNGEMKILLEAFKGHINKTILLSKQKPRTVMLNEKKLENIIVNSVDDGYMVTINFEHENKTDLIQIKY